MSMVAIVDYGVGNLFSVRSSLRYIGEEAVIAADGAAIRRAERIVLPGVGAFSDAAEKLRTSGLADVVREAAEKGTPLLGICLGMQLLFEKSLEFGAHEGLSLLPGTVAPMEPKGLKIPHIGWNALSFPADRPKNALFRNTEPGECVYFVHSYHGTDCADAVTATAEYGMTVTAAAARGNVYGTQFHPEKSGETGLRILRAFCTL